MGTHSLAQSLMQRGVARPTLYSVKLPDRWGNRIGVAGRKGIDKSVNDYLDLYCKSIRIPEGRLDVVQANGQEHMGIARETPQNFVYGKPLTMSIIENSDYMIYKAMRGWIESTGTPGVINQRTQRTLRMAYYDSFVGDIEVYKYELPNGTKVDKLIEDGKINTAGYKVPIGWRFYSAYPINIGALDLASDATDQPLTFDVDFTYESYSVIKYKRGQLDDIYKREDLGDLADVILV